MKSFISFFILLFFFGGCTADLTEPEINFKPPKYVEEMPAKEQQQDFVSTGSIFGQGDSPLFSDHKAMHINDIVTVVISESTQSSNVAAKQLSENNNMALGGISVTQNGKPSFMNSLTNISANGQSSSSFKGQGSATKNAKFNTTVSARIVKVLANGNYFIVGKREILVDNQKQIMQISGVIRPYDISQNNEILSSQMSDAKILYKTEGDVDRATQTGWGAKIIQAIWPF